MGPAGGLPCRERPVRHLAYCYCHVFAPQVPSSVLANQCCFIIHEPCEPSSTTVHWGGAAPMHHHHESVILINSLREYGRYCYSFQSCGLASNVASTLCELQTVPKCLEPLITLAGSVLRPPWMWVTDGRTDGGDVIISWTRRLDY